MAKWVSIVVGLSLLLLAWQRERLSRAGQAVRHWSDVPVNLVLLLTSEFERQGRDPAKADPGRSMCGRR